VSPNSWSAIPHKPVTLQKLEKEAKEDKGGPKRRRGHVRGRIGVRP
jgi:hypothetical protein